MKSETYHPLFQQLLVESRTMDETNDCTVKAVCVTTGLPYNQVHEVFRQCGRKSGRGVHRSVTFAALSRLGYYHIDMTMDFYHCDLLKTMAGLKGKVRKDHTYLVFINGHVAGLKNGEVIDWTNSRRHRIMSVYRVVKKAC